MYVIKQALRHDSTPLDPTSIRKQIEQEKRKEKNHPSMRW